MRNIYQYSAIILISVILGSSLYMLNNNVVALEDEDKRGYYVTLELYQYRDGELIDKRIIEDDYILRNLAYLYLHALSGDRYSDSKDNYIFIDTDNAEFQIVTKIYFKPSYATIKLGTGTNPVAVTNYKLQTEVLSQQVDDGTIWVVGNQFNVTADSTMVSDGSYSITEAGLKIGFGEIYASPKHFLICRDVFSPISVVNADVIVVRYIFRFNM